MLKVETAAIFQWDVRNWSRAIKVWKPYLSKKEDKKAAAFGEREGGLSLWLTSRGYEVECSDYGANFELAKKLHKAHGIEEKVRYSNQDITHINFPDESFDLVIFKSVIGALGDKNKQQKALDELFRVLKPGGVLLFAENLEASGLHRFFRKKYVNWANRWRYLQWKETDELLKKFSSTDKKAYGFFAVFGRTEKQRNFLSYFDFLSLVMPKKWRYILFVAAKK